MLVLGAYAGADAGPLVLVLGAYGAGPLVLVLGAVLVLVQGAAAWWC